MKKYIKRSSKRYIKRSSKKHIKRSSKKRSKRSFKRSFKRKNKDGGLGSSKIYLEKEEIESIYKNKIMNFDDIVNFLFRDEDIFSKYRYKITIEKKLIEYIKNYIRRPIKVRIYTLSGIYTPTYMDIKNYLLYY